jgi:hypothetical protein
MEKLEKSMRALTSAEINLVSGGYAERIVVIGDGGYLPPSTQVLSALQWLSVQPMHFDEEWRWSELGGTDAELRFLEEDNLYQAQMVTHEFNYEISRSIGALADLGVGVAIEDGQLILSFSAGANWSPQQLATIDTLVKTISNFSFSAGATYGAWDSAVKFETAGNLFGGQVTAGLAENGQLAGAVSGALGGPQIEAGVSARLSLNLTMLAEDAVRAVAASGVTPTTAERWLIEQFIFQPGVNPVIQQQYELLMGD